MRVKVGVEFSMKTAAVGYQEVIKSSHLDDAIG